MSNMSDLQEIIIQQPEESGLGSFTIGDLGVFIGTLGGVITSICGSLGNTFALVIKINRIRLMAEDEVSGRHVYLNTF